ncbi:hypothetical protein ONE63_006256 [Megalurothrips usitatus]|uniref:Uncharacterized protein n=1 Tax=Megalurothrips usitatus TaxID=439358 RepID=A0AAV7XVE6_9NEOP|nr:hypothetical protein ONE63_006256 [Megalurothrips usitatus]
MSDHSFSTDFEMANGSQMESMRQQQGQEKKAHSSDHAKAIKSIEATHAVWSLTTQNLFYAAKHAGDTMKMTFTIGNQEPRMSMWSHGVISQGSNS